MIYPPKLEASPLAWLLKPKYRAVHQQNQHMSVVCCGAPGSGKSYASLYIGEIMDPEFDIQESVVFSAKDFSRIVSKKLSKGKVIIIDDSGLTAGSSDAMTKEVKSISKTLQSIRHRNLIIILNLPNLFLLAKSVRTLIEFYIEPVKINKSQGICHAKFRIISTNPVSGQMFLKMPIKTIKEKHWTGYTRTVQMKTLTVPFRKPSMGNIYLYEKLKDEKLMEFNVKQSEELSYKDKKRLGKNKKEILEEMKEENEDKDVADAKFKENLEKLKNLTVPNLTPLDLTPSNDTTPSRTKPVP